MTLGELVLPKVPEYLVLQYVVIVAAAFLLIYRLLVALAFCLIAKRLSGVVDLEPRDILYVGIASFFDTVLGLLAIGSLAFTSRTDVEAATRMITRIRDDLREAASVLSGIEDVEVQNIVRDMKLVSDKLESLVKSRRVGSRRALEFLRELERISFAIRDRSDDLSLEKDAKRADRLKNYLASKLERSKELVDKLVEIAG